MKDRMEKLDEILEAGGTKKKILFLVISGAALLLSFLNGRLHFWNAPFDPAWIAILLCGIPIILEAIIGLVTEFDITSDVLVAVALIAAVMIKEYFAAGEVAFIMQIGELLEELTTERARAGIEKLVELTPRTARLITESGEVEVPAEQVATGDVLRVLPGETVPVDGVITSGQTSIDRSALTGESLPVDRAEGDEVESGAVNRFGAFEMRATRVGEDSSLQRMIRLVQSANADKAKIVRLADRWATWIVIAAVTAAILTWVITRQPIRAVTVLVVFCPCALVLATPTAIMAAIGNAAQRGALVKEGDALERLASVSRVTFDKTGTLTLGNLRVASVTAEPPYSEEELLTLAAAAEKNSEHPIGQAIAAACAGGLRAAEDFRMIPGEGVSAVVEGKAVLAGNRKLLEERGVDFAEVSGAADTAGTRVLVAVDGTYAGVITLADTVREDSVLVIREIRSLGVEPVLLTGDNEAIAATVAESLGIREVEAGCLPEDKLNKIGALQASGDVCMVGDGINDAPALKKANVGIAMGGIGSDIAIEAADIALVEDDIRSLPHLLALSRRMMRTIKLNITFALALNFLAIALAITGVLGPVVGALVHNAGSVLVISNSAMLRLYKRK